MTKKLQQVIAITILLAISLLIFYETPAYAHRLLIRPIESGVVRIVYDDDTVVGKAEVIIYGENEIVLEQGQVDADGYYKYDKNLPIVLIVANDGLGHRARWTYGDEVKEELPILPKAVLTVAVLVFVAAFFHYRNTNTNTNAQVK